MLQNKRKLGIFAAIASRRMQIFNLESFKKTFPQLLGVILASMDAYSKDQLTNQVQKSLKTDMPIKEALIFAQWVSDGDWVYMKELKAWKKNYTFTPHNFKTSKELYQLFKDDPDNFIKT